MRIVCRCKTSLSLHSWVNTSKLSSLQLPHVLRSPSPVIGLRAVRLPKTVGKIPSCIYAPVKEWQKRATLGAVFGALPPHPSRRFNLFLGPRRQACFEPPRPWVTFSTLPRPPPLPSPSDHFWVLKLCPKNGPLSIYSVGHGWQYIIYATSLPSPWLQSLWLNAVHVVQARHEQTSSSRRTGSIIVQYCKELAYALGSSGRG
jgi:hypothetical protein